MALQKQHIPLSITDGLDTKTDEKNVLATKWLAAENIDYTKTGSASKRPGYLPLDTSIEGGDTLPESKALSILNEELLLYGGNKLYSYSQNKSTWFDKGSVSVAAVSQDNIDVTNTSAFRQAYEVISGICFYAYQAETAAADTVIKIRITDNVTKTILANHTISASSITLLTAGQVGNHFIIVYRESTAVKYVSISVTSVSSISTSTLIGNSATNFGDCVYYNNKLYLIWEDNVSGVDIAYIDSSLNPSFPINLSSSAVTYVSASLDSSNNIRFCYNNTTVLYNASLVQVHAPTTFNVTMSATNATAVADASNSASSVILYHKNSDAGQIGIKAVRVNSSGTVTDLGFILYAANLASKIQVLDSQYYFLCHKKYNSGDGETRGYFLASLSGQIIARVADGVGLKRGDLSLAPLHVDSDKLQCFLSEYYQFFDTVNPSNATATTVLRYTFDFSVANNFYDAVLGRSLHTAGGVLYSYDANKIVEHGFLEIPPAPTGAIVDISPTVGVGTGSPGDYPQDVQYCIVYAWNDAQGQIHRSAPSLPLTISIPDNTSKVTLTVKPITLTSKENVEIEVYRTEGNGTSFYKVSALSGVTSTTNNILLNDKTAASITFSDVAPDSSIISKELLYTSGGVLENLAPDASRYVVSYKGRLVLMSSDGTYLQYSKLSEQSTGVSFNDALKINLDSFGGEGTSLGVMDDNLIIFKKRALYVVSGEGPNNLGEQDDFRRPALITSDVGCTDPGSIVSTPGGLMFKSEKGIYLLQRNMSVIYIGAAVELYNNLTVTSGTLIAETNQVRFTTSDTTVLVYDYFHNRWSTYENLQCSDALIFQNVYTILRPAGVVLKQSGYVDDGNYIPMVLESSWVQFAGIQGFQRFYKMLVLGKYFNKHQVKVSFAYDFNETFVDEVLIPASDLFDRSPYGTDVYGTDIYGGESNVYQFEVYPKRQKCESFRFRIETFSDGEEGPDATLSNFMLIVGSKNTSNKTKDAVNFGADSA